MNILLKAEELEAIRKSHCEDRDMSTGEGNSLLGHIAALTEKVTDVETELAAAYVKLSEMDEANQRSHSINEDLLSRLRLAQDL